MSDSLTDRDAPGRIVRNIHQVEMLPNDLDGGDAPQDNVWYAPLTYDHTTHQNGCYLFKMGPGSESIPHVHRNNEDYLILEGELIEDDGTVLKPGDFVHYDKGTRHNSRTDTGCLILVSEWLAPDQR